MENEISTVSLNIPSLKEQNPELIFIIEEKWIMKITEDGIKFNRKEFDLTEDEFSENVLKMLEDNYNVIFKKREGIWKLK